MNLAASDQSAELGSALVKLAMPVFDRAGDTPGLEFWTNHLRAGVPLQAVADGFTGAPEFQARYGTPDDAEFTALLYRNVLDREGEPGGLTFWTNVLQSFDASRTQVVVGFSESPEHVALVTPDRALERFRVWWAQSKSRQDRRAPVPAPPRSRAVCSGST